MLCAALRCVALRCVCVTKRCAAWSVVAWCAAGTPPSWPQTGPRLTYTPPPRQGSATVSPYYDGALVAPGSLFAGCQREGKKMVLPYMLCHCCCRSSAFELFDWLTHERSRRMRSRSQSTSKRRRLFLRALGVFCFSFRLADSGLEASGGGRGVFSLSLMAVVV